MNGCDDCVYADWKRTKNGRLHPDKTGRCKFVWSPPPLPKAFSFSFSYNKSMPTPSGGFIERGCPRCDGCECFKPKEGDQHASHRLDEGRTGPSQDA